VSPDGIWSCCQLAFALAVVLAAFLLVLLLYARQRSLFVAQSLAVKEALQLANDVLSKKLPSVRPI
jgi:hypothetical protein